MPPERSLASFDVDLLGRRHRYHAVVPEPARTRAVVALHGFGTNGYRTFRYIAPPLVRAGTPLYALDLLGFGGSERPAGGYGLHGYARYVRAFVRHLGLEAPALVGHSMGGKVVAATAVLYPGLAARLVLINPGGFSRWARWLPLAGRPRWVARLFEQPWFVQHVLPRTPLGPIFPDAESRALVGRFRTSHARLDLDAARLRPHLGAVATPTLVLWGADDPILPLSAGRRAAGSFPDGRFVLIPEAGHAPMKDRPEATAEALLAFL